MGCLGSRGVGGCVTHNSATIRLSLCLAVKLAVTYVQAMYRADPGQHEVVNAFLLGRHRVRYKIHRS